MDLKSYARAGMGDAFVALGWYVNRALWPWRPGSINLYRSENLYGPTKITLELGLLPDMPFVFKFDPFADPDERVAEMGRQAFEFYRYRPSLPVDDHIILGEN